MTVLKVLGGCFCNIPQRAILAVFGFLAVINAFSMRNVLNIAITEMVYRQEHNATNRDNTCPGLGEGSTAERKGFEWSEQLQGVILGAFYWGYAATHVPGGILSAKYGGKYMLSLGILSTGILSLLTPLVIEYGGAAWLIVIRILMGFGEGTTFPALSTLLAAWIPVGERTKATALVYGGGQIGNVFANLISGILIDQFGGWSSPFYFFGGCGVIWFIFFELFCYKDPASHPFITEKEKSYLLKELKQLSRDKTINKIPWKSILTSIPMIALVLTHFGHGIALQTITSDLPKYMSDVLKYDIKENGFYSSLPYIAMWITTIIFSIISDWTITKKYISITNSRKLYTTLSFTIAGVFIVVASFGGCNRAFAVTMFTVVMGFMGAFFSGYKVNSLDLSPNFAGTLTGISNVFYSITGIIAPYIVGALTPNRTLSEWRIVFWITFGCLVASNIIFLIWSSGETQSWNTPASHQPIENGTADENKNEAKTINEEEEFYQVKAEKTKF